MNTATVSAAVLGLVCLLGLALIGLPGFLAGFLGARLPRPRRPGEPLIAHYDIAGTPCGAMTDAHHCGMPLRPVGGGAGLYDFECTAGHRYRYRHSPEGGHEFVRRPVLDRRPTGADRGPEDEAA